MPDYWQPPTLLDLAARTGFDLESVPFAFATGGVASPIYPALVPVQEKGVGSCERRRSRHCWHRLMLSVPFFASVKMYFEHNHLGARRPHFRPLPVLFPMTDPI